jgi:hypothetical protein
MMINGHVTRGLRHALNYMPIFERSGLEIHHSKLQHLLMFLLFCAFAMSDEHKQFGIQLNLGNLYGHNIYSNVFVDEDEFEKAKNADFRQQ